MRSGLKFFLRIVASAILTTALFVIVPTIWHPEGKTDEVYYQADALNGYVNSFSDTNWRDVVPKVQDASRGLNDGIYRLRKKLGEDRPWNEKPFLWFACFAGLIYVSYQTKHANSPNKPYRLNRNGSESGPFTVEQLRSMWESGMLTSDTTYRSEGEQQWSSLAGLIEPEADSSTFNAVESAPILSQDPSPFAPAEITDPFGLTSATPIPATSITASRYYLKWLATPDRMRVHAKRAGGFGGVNSGEAIDIYNIHDYSGLLICKIYICPYAKEDTIESPQGLIYFRPSIEMFDARTQRRMRAAYDANFKADLKREKEGRAAMQKALQKLGHAARK